MQNQPKVSLSGIEFLCLSIQANPGKSQRFHIKRLQRYKTGKDCPGNGNRGSGYFNSPFYRNVLWFDQAPKTQYIGRGKWKAPSARMYIKGRGNDRANEARQKLGLSPIEYIPHVELVQEV